MLSLSKVRSVEYPHSLPWNSKVKKTIHSFYCAIRSKLFEYSPAFLRVRIEEQRKRADRARYQLWRQGRVINAGTVRESFRNFKHVVDVDYSKSFVNREHPFIDEIHPELATFLWPERPLDSAGLLTFVRGSYINGEFVITDLGNQDRILFCTDSDEDALLVTLKFS